MEDSEFFEKSQDALLKNGLKLLKFGEISDAITCFQNYLQFNLDNISCWQNLADAYFIRGSYNTAIKAYLKAIKLKNNENNDFYSELKIAAIHQLIHDYEDALNDYQVILDQNPNHIPALIGKAETLLSLARKSFISGFLNEGEDFCQKVVNTIEQSFSIRNDIALQYDILSHCNLLMITNMTEMSNDDKINTILVGIKNTNRALSINIHSQSYWHHLGIFYWYLFQNTNEKIHYSKSIQSLINSIKINPLNSNIWNTLGVIAGDNLSVSQHCLLKSLSLSSESTEIQWSNLGVCYMKDANQTVNLEKDIIFKAHDAFNESQAQNPNYVNCWIGQSLIAENVNHSSTLDLFRHCNTLEYHSVPTIKFAYHLLLDTRKTLNKVDLYNLAIDNMCIFVKKKNNDPLALNLLGCLYEKRNYKKTAFQYFKKALFHSNNSTNYVKNSIKINYLRNFVYFEDIEKFELDEQLYKNNWEVPVYYCLGYLLKKDYEQAFYHLKISLSIADFGSVIYYLIDGLKYLISDKINKTSELSLNSEMVETNEPLRTMFIVNDLLSRNLSIVSKKIITSVMILPKLLDMIIISLFSQDTSFKFAKDFSDLPQTWIKQCLDYLIDPENDLTDDYKEFNRIYRNFIFCKEISPKQLIGFQLLICLNLLESKKEECLHKSLINIQLVYSQMPYDYTIKLIFETVIRIKNKELSSKDFLDEISMTKQELIIFVLNFFY